jgi:DNA-binding FadR family transcriptional regulator
MAMSKSRPTLTIVGTAPAVDRRTRRARGGRPKLAIVVREHLLADIRAGRWRPGDRLPTELELMAQFGVSRAPIREAMQSLHLLGIVDISPRRGATVRALALDSVLDLAVLSGAMGRESPIADVYAFRDVTEGAIGELSAANITEVQVEKLREILADNVAAVALNNLVESRKVDLRFHAAIAEASGNTVFQAVSRAMNGLLAELRRATGGIPGASEASLGEHEEIFRALAAHDGPAARRASERHIRNTRARYEAAVRSASDDLVAETPA